MWQLAPPATDTALAALQDQVSLELPPEYIAQLVMSNGGEGDLSVEPRWIQLWSAEEGLAMNEGYQIQKWLPGYLGFASSGGGELLAFKVRNGLPYPVVMVPFIAMDVSKSGADCRLL
jgi:hypothetical protein